MAMTDGGGFRKSSYSIKYGKCVEVKFADGSILVRHSVHTQNQVQFTSSEWEAFLEGVKAGEFDLVNNQ